MSYEPKQVIKWKTYLGSLMDSEEEARIESLVEYIAEDYELHIHPDQLYIHTFNRAEEIEKVIRFIAKNYSVSVKDR